MTKPRIRPTPRTDDLRKAWINSTDQKPLPPFDQVEGTEAVLLNFAASLERDRAELIEALERVVDALNEPGMMDVDLWKRECKQATGENAVGRAGRPDANAACLR